MATFEEKGAIEQEEENDKNYVNTDEIEEKSVAI
jgi:hypothetical protein